MLLVVALVQVGCAAAQAEDPGELARQLRSFEYGAEYLTESPNTEFTAVDFVDLPRNLKSGMYNRLAFILEWSAHPQTRGKWDAAGRMTIRVAVASGKQQDDLVEYTWDHLGQRLRTVSSRDALRLDIDLDELTSNGELDEYGPTAEGRVRGLLAQTLRLDGESVLDGSAYHVDIPWPASVADGTRFSTNPEQSIQAMSTYGWYRRVDFAVHNRVLSAMFYLKPGQLMGPSDGSEWFDDAFRAKVLAQAKGNKEPGRVEPSGDNSP